ncbi:hypothetical protein ALT_8548 [Aspergillus lentulus]|uniref:Uncharacterized protein n=1 Tax=Aspergillus lentulus TaxID=293939 RepID=A0AAN6BT02_ASPLE|nr:hypothetical protein CNMCM6069_005211 [Aspergillus lentulus]KAF4169895.1 hypothetical protein CNMCM6936_006131 [Aspergillus lentulus]KAF4183128.1 hypothetical protein CNMCM8060_005155 [Aspergillus lentulus]KAF4190480.1 hypothetical protein CNMCM7927_003450 [Aspergillus lentulus]KAF4199443.1 hypothetical protein CNMCM8694_005116 [Aspergillus lentulus]
MDQQPLSPPAEPEPSSTANPPSNAPVPLDSPLRTTPIHPCLPDIRVPSSPLKPYQYDPVTCTPIDLKSDSIRSQFDHLRTEYPSPSAALKAQEQVAKEAKRKIEEAEKKREEVQKAMDKKVKERDTEMKVLSKYQKHLRGSLGWLLREDTVIEHPRVFPYSGDSTRIGGARQQYALQLASQPPKLRDRAHAQNTTARNMKRGLMGK